MTPLSGIHVTRRHAPFVGGLVPRDAAPRPFDWPSSSSDAREIIEAGFDAASEQRDLMGNVLEGAYRITGLIAMGGMSTVYEAVQVRLNQRVAVKVMARELASNDEALARFRREAEVTSRLRHPHLVTVTDFGTAPGGEPFLVMEYLEGVDLDQRIHQRGPLPLSAAVSITKQAAAALGAAHDQGIVHRDLKPANVFLVELADEPEFVKILDFGISKVRAATSQLTRASFIIGTPYYMSPEQATGMVDEIDHRTDQWALGCIAWEMLSGRVPFAGDDMSAVFYQIIHLDPAPLGPRVPGLPPAVEAVLRRALSKNMADRFPSVRDFASALESAALGQVAEPSVLASETWTQAPAAKPRVRDVWRALLRDPIITIAAACAAVVLAVVLGSAGSVAPRRTPSLEPAPANAAPEPIIEPPNVPPNVPLMSVGAAPSEPSTTTPATGLAGPGAATKGASMPAKARAVPARAPAEKAVEAAEAEPADPFQPPAPVEDPADPFAPSPPAMPPPARAGRAPAADPADPFAP